MRQGCMERLCQSFFDKKIRLLSFKNERANFGF